MGEIIQINGKSRIVERCSYCKKLMSKNDLNMHFNVDTGEVTHFRCLFLKQNTRND